MQQCLFLLVFLFNFFLLLLKSVQTGCRSTWNNECCSLITQWQSDVPNTYPTYTHTYIHTTLLHCMALAEHASRIAGNGLQHHNHWCHIYACMHIHIWGIQLLVEHTQNVMQNSVPTLLDELVPSVNCEDRTFIAQCFVSLPTIIDNRIILLPPAQLCQRIAEDLYCTVFHQTLHYFVHFRLQTLSTCACGIRSIHKPEVDSMPIPAQLSTCYA